ncbi:4-hydroxybenzoate octaprenyltransferase [Candidatus Pelagibacter communis]|uniref:4-hydroxybenzoate octaprenyltransferase n=1 Tax=Pelagibacter ubique TaxID=198252 RepID=UPI00094C2FE6|nr:4-hydroxybenzoate octaprenyltransferase [Candidatus Pelagibacter ubique]
MKHLKIFIDLTRLNKPIGFMLLFWPCAWGLTYAFSFNQNNYLYIQYLVLFFLGSVLMRSAGCIFNDIVDRDFDKKVKRTKKRPIASNLISVNRAFLYVIALCSLAFLILIQFNWYTITLGLGSMVLAFSYPFMKRITYWPQLFLGITFNWGLIMAWTSMNNEISLEILILYISAIFWTLGYDTIYGAQDMSDDEIIGLKSTSIKFKKNIKIFVGSCYFLSALFLIFVFENYLGINFFTLFLLIFFLTLIFQIKIFKKEKEKTCLQAFKTNNLSGLILFLSIYSI